MAVSWSTPIGSSGSKAVRRVTVAAEQIQVGAGVLHLQSWVTCALRLRCPRSDGNRLRPFALDQSPHRWCRSGWRTPARPHALDSRVGGDEFRFSATPDVQPRRRHPAGGPPVGERRCQVCNGLPRFAELPHRRARIRLREHLGRKLVARPRPSTTAAAEDRGRLRGSRA
jgi:hypothetical protein